MFECKRCGHKANRSRDLKLHLKRKFICHPLDDSHDTSVDVLIKELDDSNIKTFQCTFCKKYYSTKLTQKRHLKTCKEANKKIVLTVKEFDERLDEKIKRMTDDIKGNIKPSIVINDNSTNIITFNDGGALLNCDERTIETFYKHLSKDKQIEIAKVKLDNIPTKLIGDIFFNEDRKENMVLAVLSEKKDQASVYENGRWSRKDSARAILSHVFQIMLQKIYEANDAIPRDQRVNRNLYELVQPHKLHDVTNEIVHYAHYNLYKVREVHGTIPQI